MTGIRFCDFLVGHGQTLASCRQADVDAWASSQPRSRVSVIRGFATWASARKAMPRLDIPAGRSPLAPPAFTADERWQLARRLLDGAGIDPALRVAGALVVIYAQPLFRISRLRLDDLNVTDDRVLVRLGGSAVELPEPLSGHVRELLACRQLTPRKAQLPTDPGWLFPGRVPGRAILPAALSEQLARHGVRAAAHRLTALFDLAAELPAPLLSDILGISRHTAAAWSRLASRSWVDYPGMRGTDA